MTTANCFCAHTPIPRHGLLTYLNALRLFKRHSNLKYLSPLLHVIDWDWKSHSVAMQPFQEPLSETIPLTGTWPWPLLTSAWAGPMPYQTLYVQHWDSEQHAVTQNGHLGKRGTEVSLCTLEGSGQPDPEGQSRTEGRSRGSGLKSQSVLILGDSLNFLILNFSPWKSGQWQYQPPRAVGGIQWDHP